MRVETEQLPYITHLFSTALLVAEDGAHDDVVTAALLHDTLEDTDTTRKEIVNAFNEHVAVLVESVSEVEEENGKKLDWKERKTHYLANLEKVSDEALLIAIADKVDNVESMLEAVEKEGTSFFKNWDEPYEEHSWFHGEVLRLAQTRLPDHRLTKRLGEAHTKEKEMFAGEPEKGRAPGR